MSCGRRPNFRKADQNEASIHLPRRGPAYLCLCAGHTNKENSLNKFSEHIHKFIHMFKSHAAHPVTLVSFFNHRLLAHHGETALEMFFEECHVPQAPRKKHVEHQTPFDLCGLIRLGPVSSKRLLRQSFRSGCLLPIPSKHVVC